MPLDVVRLRDSDISAISSGDEFRSAVLLWCASWHQVPAASLPDDDTVLSQLAGYGRVVKEWKKIRTGALRGWIKCSDGRLYHPVVAEKANEAWDRKLEQSWRTECSRIKKLNQRHGISLPFPTLEQFLSPDYVPQKAPAVPNVSPGTFASCPEGQSSTVPNVSPGKRTPIDSGQWTVDSGHKTSSSTAEPLPHESATIFPEVPNDPGVWLQWFNATQGLQLDPGSRFDRKGFWPLATRWCKAGVSIGAMQAAIGKAVGEAREPIAYLPAYVDRVLATQNAPPQPMTQAAAGTLAAARTIFGTEIEGQHHDTQPAGRIIDITPTTPLDGDCPRLPRTAG